VFAGPNHERPNHVFLLNKYDKDFKEPSIEELVVRLITGEELPWAVPEIESLHASYYRERRFKKTLLIGEFLEAIFTLRLAEANRLAGNEKRARELVAFAVEALPAHAGLRSYERRPRAGKVEPYHVPRDFIGAGPNQRCVYR
jgi:hypothetical protein